MLPFHRLIHLLAILTIVGISPCLAISHCATTDKNLNISIPCIKNNNSVYKAGLSYYVHPNDKSNLFWKLAGLENGVETPNCATASAQLILDFPCVDVDNTTYTATLEPFINSLDTASYYWRLADAQIASNTTESYTCADLSPTAGELKILATASVFPGVVDDGSQIIISYATANDLYIHPHDYNLSPSTNAIPVTNSGNVMDHKHLFFQNAHYLLYSTSGDSDLFLLKLDRDFQVIDTVTVVQNSTNTKTNDMLLGSDGTYIITGRFRPGNLNNFENNGHQIKRYDSDLNPIEPEIVANDIPHVNTASIININSNNYLIAPSTPVSNKEVATQRDLILIRYNANWVLLDNQAHTLVDSHNLLHQNDGDGIWMSTGIAHMSNNQCLLVGHTFVDASAGSDTGKIYLRLFNDNDFSESSTLLISESAHSNRVHFLLKDNVLYVVFDDSGTGSPAIKGLIYQLK